MKKVLLVLICVGLMSVASAFTITNGDFETGGGENIDDVTGWYDLSTGSFWEGAWQTNASWITANGTNVVVLSAYNTVAGDPLAGSYLYQSMGASAGESSVMIGFDWGHPDDTAAGRIDGITISVLASDGSFVADDAIDVYGAAGVSLLDSASYDHVALGTDGEIFPVEVTLDLSGANAGDEIFLRFNSYMPEGGDPWPILDNISIVPEPATLVLLGLGGLLLRKCK
ncbi:MAG: PEP-CTERM sorting domain-containing protein [Sedimentisphaerales bacterium]|nr:PEP-CTERM sorting domain-containing protein [Sedimentisphaerales bacterium]